MALLERAPTPPSSTASRRPATRIGVTAGLPAGEAGGTNLFKVHTVT